MKIVELSDYSMVVMKDSNDYRWLSVGDIYRAAQKYGKAIIICADKNDNNDGSTQEPVEQISSEAIYTAGRLVLFFNDPVDSRFKLQDRVTLSLSYYKQTTLQQN